MIWGSPPGTDDTYYKRLLDGGLPMFRTFGNCVAGGAGLRRLLDVRGALPLAVRRRRRPRRCPRPRRRARILDGLAPGEALSEWRVEAAAEAYGIKTSQGRAVRIGEAAAVKAASAHRLPGRDEGLVARPVAQERCRARAGRRRVGEGSARRLRRAARPRRSKADGQEGAHRRRARLRDGDAAASRRWSASRRTTLFGPGRHGRARRDLRRGASAT